MTITNAVDKLSEKFSSAITEEKEFRGEKSLSLQATSLHDVCLFARDILGFDYLVDITSVDHFGDEPRFEIVYELYSMKEGVHLRLKISVSEDNCLAPTVSDIWPTADWHEREIFDMMGIRFENHPDLRRILMWDGYPFYPLRKDFPLEGKASDVPDVAFTNAAPLAGGPFVTIPSESTSQVREPRARQAGETPSSEKFIEEP